MRSSSVFSSWLLTLGGGALLAVWVGLSACQSSELPAAPEASRSAPRVTGVNPSFDVGAVMRQAGRAFRADKGTFTTSQDTWRVRVQPDGTARFESRQWPQPFSSSAEGRPARELELPSPQPLTGAPLDVRTVAVSRGGSSLMQGLAVAAREDGALALSRGQVVEVFHNGDDGLEQRWELAARPEGQGDLEVRVALGGLEYAGQTETGHHFVDPTTRLGVRYGLATWVDAAGARTAVRTVRDGGEWVMRVPAAVLDGAAYPAVLDPIVSPEMGVDMPVPLPALGPDILPAVAFGGGVYLVAWMHYGNTSYDILAARVRGSDGALLDPGSITLSVASGDQYYPAVASSGSEFLVAWTGGPGLVSARVRASDGQVLDATPKTLAASPAAAGSPSMTFDGANYFVVWNDTRNASTGSDIYGARVRASDGVALDGSGIPICVLAGNQSNPSVAFDGARYLVVWEDNRNASTGYDIYGARVRASDRAVLDTGGLPISTATRTQGAPVVVFDGTQFLVAWDDARNHVEFSTYDVYGARVRGTDGAVLDASGIAIATGAGSQGATDVASNGNGALVVWQNQLSSTAYDVYSARVGSDGTVSQVQALGPAATSTHQERVPVVAFNGSDYLVAWEDSISSTNDIQAVRVRGSDGTALDPVALVVSTDANTEDAPAVAQGNGIYFVVWRDLRNRSNGSDVYGVRVRAKDGVVLDATARPLATTSSNDEFPLVGSDGQDFLVVWSNFNFNIGNYDVYGVRVRGSDGQVLDSSPLILSTAAGSQLATSVSYGEGYYLVTWTDSRTDAGDIHATRVRASDGRVMEPGGFPVSKAARSQSAAKAAYGAGVFLVAWSDGRVDTSAAGTEVYGARVRAADGVLLDDVSTGKPLAQANRNQFGPSVAFDGTQFLVAWQDARNGNVDLYGTRVRASDGVALDPAGLVLSNAAGDQTESDLLFDGRHYLLVWADYIGDVFRIRANRLTPAVTPVDGTGFDIAAGWTWNVAAWGPGQALVVYASSGTGRQVRVKMRQVSDPANGSLCADGAQCDSGLCTDGVCCNSACGGGQEGDCQACSVAAGGAVDGTCGPVTVSAAKVCRVSLGTCDVAEQCDGVNMECPADGVAAAGVECRPRDGDCDVAEVCDGTSGVCPANALAPDGTACDDGSACSQTDTCQSGTCMGAEPVVCTAPNPCMRPGMCDPVSGTCSPPQPVEDGTACDDGNACTQSDTCQAGACTGTNPVTCAAGDSCHLAGTCDPSTGTCSAPTPVSDGTACDDDNACTQSDTCQAGACTGANPVVCTAGDACHVAGTCDPSTGTCSAPTDAPDGTSCDDGNACTQSDSCRAGICTGEDPVVCTAPNSCMQPGVCDASTGVCSAPMPVADGASCDDGNACTQSDTCQAGTCTGTNPVTCSAGDACHVAGTCDPSTGTCSAPVPAADGTACNDGNACTQSDTCQSGTCTGTNPVTCTAGDACHVAGTCNPSTGLCSEPMPAQNGTACDDGNACTRSDSCQSGTCTGADPIVCGVSDTCHAEGTCNPSTGTCSDPVVDDGTPCTGGTCQTGACVPTPDAGTSGEDAGSASDAGGTDADAGTQTDAGENSDAGSPPDAGEQSDAGSQPDAGEQSDAGTLPPVRPIPPEAVGCSCGVPAGSADMGLLLLIAGAALLRRSRRQHP